VIDEKTIAVHLDRKISETELKKALIIANNLILTGRKVESRIYKKNEIPEKIKTKLRGELDKVEQDQARVMIIEDLDYSLCGGTHCQNIQEIGIIYLEQLIERVVKYALSLDCFFFPNLFFLLFFGQL
jgi:Ser-tRNA(Ala) deacylase AlaX